MMFGFDDALDLLGRRFAGTRVLVLCGESGSGKSSAIRFLMHRHPDLRGDGSLRVIEELRRLRDLRWLIAALFGGQRLLVASHLPPWLHRVLGVLAPTEVIALDDHPQKIARWLSARGIRHSEAAVAHFCRRFGANYTDVRLVVEHADAGTFDQALGRFLRQCRLERRDMPSGLPVRVMPVEQAEAHYQALNDAGIKRAP